MLLPRILAAVLLFSSVLHAQTRVDVRLVRVDDRYELQRNGKPYVIKGAGGQSELEELVARGGNSIRTWNARNLGPLLDRAQKLGVTVTVGFWLGHERHGFDYTDGKSVAGKIAEIRKGILEYKDHPAVLMWAMGNEMEGSGDNPAIWMTVNHCARMAKELDPGRPVMTVIAEVGEKKVAGLEQYCPDIDIAGINTYGGVTTAIERYHQRGGTKPCVITEYGPPGHWESKKTAWGAPFEMNSTEKGVWYRDAYRKSVLAHPDVCLGGYAFCWHHKQETTDTWFGMFLRDGSRVAAIEGVSEAWGGPKPENYCPKIGNVTVDRADGLKSGDEIHASVIVSDPDGDPLKVQWVLRRETSIYGFGGDHEADQPEFASSIVKSDGGKATVRLPGGGSYRLFAYVRDGKGNAAVANVPIHAEGEPPPHKLAKAKLPLVLYSEGDPKSPYAPSGVMGDQKFVRRDFGCKTNPKSGETCLKVQFASPKGWGGVAWLAPANDWGDRPGGRDLSDATHLEFWARGKDGGETVTFGLGLLGADKPFPDSSRVELKDASLTKEWNQFRIPLAGRDLSTIKTGFYWSLSARGKEIEFYLDDIRYVKDTP